MNLTNREKVLLIIFLVVVILTGLYYFVIAPAIDDIKSLESEFEKSNEDVTILNNELKLHKELKNKYNDFYNEISLISDNYYSRIIQEKIIILLKEVIDISNLEVENITFSDPEVSNIEEKDIIEDDKKSVLDIIIENYTNDKYKEEEKKSNEEINTDKMSINIDFKGTYDELLLLIKEIENNDKRIIISYITISKSDTNLSGSFTLDLYTIPSLFKDLEEIFDYEFNSEFGRRNPFY